MVKFNAKKNEPRRSGEDTPSQGRPTIARPTNPIEQAVHTAEKHIQDSYSRTQKQFQDLWNGAWGKASSFISNPPSGKTGVGSKIDRKGGRSTGAGAGKGVLDYAKPTTPDSGINLRKQYQQLFDQTFGVGLNGQHTIQDTQTDEAIGKLQGQFNAGTYEEEYDKIMRRAQSIFSTADQLLGGPPSLPQPIVDLISRIDSHEELLQSITDTGEDDLGDDPRADDIFVEPIDSTPTPVGRPCEVLQNALRSMGLDAPVCDGGELQLRVTSE